MGGREHGISKKGGATEGSKKIVVTDEAVHIGRVLFIHSLLDHIENLSLYPKGNGKPKRLLSKGETWSDFPFKRSLGGLTESRLEWHKEGNKQGVNCSGASKRQW